MAQVGSIEKAKRAPNRQNTFKLIFRENQYEKAHDCSTLLTSPFILRPRELYKLGKTKVINGCLESKDKRLDYNQNSFAFKNNPREG